FLGFLLKPHEQCLNRIAIDIALFLPVDVLVVAAVEYPKKPSLVLGLLEIPFQALPSNEFRWGTGKQHILFVGWGHRMYGIRESNAHGHKVDTIPIPVIHKTLLVEGYIGKPVCQGGVIVFEGPDSLYGQVVYAIYKP